MFRLLPFSDLSFYETKRLKLEVLLDSKDEKQLFRLLKQNVENKYVDTLILREKTNTITENCLSEMLAHLRAWNMRYHKESSRFVQLTYFIKNKEKKLLGFVSLSASRTSFYFNNEVEFTIFIDQKFCNQGYATECLQSLSSFLFENLVDRVWIRCYWENKRMQKIVKKLKFSLKQNDISSQNQVSSYVLEAPYLQNKTITETITAWVGTLCDRVFIWMLKELSQ